MQKVLIKNGRLIDPANQIDRIADLYLADGKIIAVDMSPDNFQADCVIDATDLIVCPGLIDLAARCREPGQEFKATISSETAAAASAGITTLCYPPDTQPAIDNAYLAEWIRHRALQHGMTKIFPLAAMTVELQGEQLSPLAALKLAGCVGVSDIGSKRMNLALRRRCFEYAATVGMKIFIQAEDFELAQDGCMHEGAVSTRLGLTGIPATAETIAIARDLMLLEQTGATAHFCRLSSADAVALIAAAKAKNLPITADVAAHQLFLTEVDVSNFNSDYHVRPPLRNEADRLALIQGLSQGVIDAICSDHQPQDDDSKSAPFALSAPGISALETLLPLTLRLAEKSSLTLSQVLSFITSAPAKILNLTSGNLTTNNAADICIFSPNKIWTLAERGIISRGHNTPMLNWDLQGQVQCTFLEGVMVFKLKE